MSDDVCDPYLHLLLPHLFGAGAPGVGAPGAEPHAREQEKANSEPRQRVKGKGKGKSPMALLTALPTQWRDAEALEASGELPQARIAWEVHRFHVCLKVPARTNKWHACMHVKYACICRQAGMHASCRRLVFVVNPRGAGLRHTALGAAVSRASESRRLPAAATSSAAAAAAAHARRVGTMELNSRWTRTLQRMRGFPYGA